MPNWKQKSDYVNKSFQIIKFSFIQTQLSFYIYFFIYVITITILVRLVFGAKQNLSKLVAQLVKAYVCKHASKQPTGLQPSACCEPYQFSYKYIDAGRLSGIMNLRIHNKSFFLSYRVFNASILAV